MLRTADLDYDLPPRLIATRPAEPRDAARLMVVSRSDPARREHRMFSDLPDLVQAGDLLVFNRTRVLPARIAGRRRDTGGKVAGLFLEEEAAGVWRVLLRSNGRLRPGLTIDLARSGDEEVGASLELERRQGAEWLAAVEPAGRPAADLLAKVGATPLPPYILQARSSKGETWPEDADRTWYQTVFAEDERAASVAAPTAGLHFTPRVLSALEQRGVERRALSLDVGWGTFKPVEADTVEAHEIHAERFCVPADTCRAVADPRRTGRRIAVGTTTARALESLPDASDLESPTRGWEGRTDLMITPGHRWRFVDGLLTNFHLPRSTLLAMVSALFPEGPSRLLDLYRVAVEREYRFYSYGDAMLILP